MGIYNQHVLPLLTDWAMGQRQLAAYRQGVVAQASGRVVEIGIGSGRNLPFYSALATEVVGVDPSAELLAIARKTLPTAQMSVEFVQCSAEDLPFADEIFDTAVVTWSLCSIPNPAAALNEVRRVLKGGGSLTFVEHGAAPSPSVRWWQDRLTPYWKRCAGGCHLNRRPDRLIAASGFQVQALKTGYAAGIKTLAYMYEGRAVKKA